MFNMTLNRKLGSMVAVIWVGLILIAAAGVLQYRASLLKDRRNQLISLVQQGESVLKHYYSLAQQNAMSEEKAKKARAGEQGRGFGVVASLREAISGFTLLS